MSGPARRRKALAIATISSLVVSAVATTVIALVAPAASASGSAADRYSVINGTANAATDHEIVGTSAFPNFSDGAIDNYYSLAHSYVDNSPSAEGTASPADTGPIGQTAAAGNFVQPQYADARWPGDKQSGTATFGNQGGPYAVAKAAPYAATAESSEVSNGSSGMALAAPKGFSSRLSPALAAWKTQWLPRLGLKISAPPVADPVTTPTVTTPTVSVPTVTVTVPIVGSTPTASTTTVTSTTSSSGTTNSRTLSSSGNAGFDSSTEVMLASGTGALVTSGESSLGRVSLGGGQIAIAGIDVSAAITNDGTPTEKVAVDVGAASIGGVPVTIDQDGVHVARQGQNLPYKQADGALNSALKQAGIQLFTVQPEITTSLNQETVRATGLHVIFTQPVHQGGVPDQYVEHILGEVFADSLAVPGVPLASLNLSGGTGSASGSGGKTPSGGGGTSAGGTSAGGSSAGRRSAGGASAGGPSTGFPTSSSPSSQPTSSPTGSASQTGPLSLVSAISKPMWLLLSYFLWQALVIVTGTSLWYWRRGAAL